MTKYSKNKIKGAMLIEDVVVMGFIAGAVALSITKVGAGVQTIFANMAEILNTAGG